MKFRLWVYLILVATTLAGRGAGDLTRAAVDWVYLDNGKVKLGVKKTSGACIGYLSLSGSNSNLLNHFDQGRFVQQSYYGKADGTKWGDKPWRWNPVQGGDYKGGPARLLEFKVQGTQLYAKTEPRHWSGCVPIPETVMEQWITLTGMLAHVRYKFTYSGTNRHPSHNQEIPAVFVDPSLDTLVLYDGKKPWSGGPLHRSRPGWPNEGRAITEHWAAYVNEKDFGVGAYVPVSSRITCYRFGSGKSPNNGSCSYFAPLIDFAITPGFVFQYDLYLGIGAAEEIRAAFAALHRQREQAHNAAQK